MAERRTDDWVSATDVASYAYCPESWRLGQPLGKKPTQEAQAVMNRGEAQHEQWQLHEKRSGLLVKLAKWLLILTLLMALFRIVLARVAAA